MELLSKARIKLIQSLQHKKYRLKYDKFIVEGLKLCKELLAEHENIVESVYISNTDYQSILSDLLGEDRICIISAQEMRTISQMTTPPGILTVCRLPETQDSLTDVPAKKIFFLESIRDPGNLGTILRIADWYGMAYIFLSPDCVDIYNHKVIQASMGSALRVKAIIMDLPVLLTHHAKDIYVCDMGGENINTLPPPANGILVLGNESQGVSEALSQNAKTIIAIPGNNSLGAESLNVASVAAIVGAWLHQE